MRLVSLDFVQEGEKLGRSIFNSKGQVLLGAGVQLNNRLKERLKSLGINHVYIYDPRLADVDTDVVLSEQTKTKAVIVLSESFNTITDKTFNAEKTCELAKMIVEDIVDQKDVTRALVDIATSADWLFNHSLNVCAIAVLLGLEYGLDSIRLQDLAVGSLLHDVGFTQIPGDLFLKKNLTEDEQKALQSHCKIGFDILRSKYSISIPAANVAFQHHEYNDGSGYPRGMLGRDIFVLGRITAVADYYVTRIMLPHYILPHQVVDEMLAISGTKLEKDVVSIFYNKVVLYPNGMTVTLSNGRSGVVVRQNSDNPHRPVVREISDETTTKNFVEYDLSQETRLNITRILL